RQPRRVQFGPHQTLPEARSGHSAKHGTIATANFKKTTRIRKVFVYKSYDEFVADDEPKMFRFEFRKRLEMSRVHSADGVGKMRREHRNAIALSNDVSSGETSPTTGPAPTLFSNRLYRTAPQATALL